MSDVLLQIDSPHFHGSDFGVPSWAHHLGLATWVTDPDGNIVFFNEPAEELFELPATACVGLPCYKIIAGAGVDGCCMCQPNSPLSERMGNGQHLETVKMRISTASQTGRWISVLPLSVKQPDRNVRLLVHIAVPFDDDKRLRHYITKVATRTVRSHQRNNVFSRDSTLSVRENEVLSRLAEDEHPDEIARELCISHHTVRNCIQHILTKLDVHSIQEAVARDLLNEHFHREAGYGVESQYSAATQIVMPRDDGAKSRSGALSTEPIQDNVMLGFVRPATHQNRIESRSRIAKVLAHPMRLLLLEVLDDQEMCICELTGLVATDQSTVSRHMTALYREGLVDMRKDRTFTLYRRNFHGLKQLLSDFDHIANRGPRTDDP